MRMDRNALLVGVVCLVTGFPACAAALCGDADGDGRVTVSDGVQALRAAADLSNACTTSCDVDHDRSIGVSDGVNILRTAAELPAIQDCPTTTDDVGRLIAPPVSAFGPDLIKTPPFLLAAATTSCDNAEGSVVDVPGGFVFTHCNLGGTEFDGTLATPEGSLGFQGIRFRHLATGATITATGTVALVRIADAFRFDGTVSVSTPELGAYALSLDGVLVGLDGSRRSGTLVFDLTGARIPDIVEVDLTYDGTSTLPATVVWPGGAAADFVYDVGADVLTPVRATPTPHFTPTPRPSPLIVFATQNLYSGSQIHGLVGADAICAGEASSAGLPGTFRAWLSDSNTSAAARHTHGTNPYALPDGTQVADDWTDLTDGSIDAPITRHADGSESPLGGVWTATAPSGGISYPGNTCSNWTSDAGLGADGYAGATNGDWSLNSVFPLDNCALTSRLYCFQQQGNPPSFPTPTPTSTPVCGNGLCESGEACQGSKCGANEGCCCTDCGCSGCGGVCNGTFPNTACQIL